MKPSSKATRHTLKKLALAVGCGTLALHGASALAAAIEEVIVTSQKTEENIQTTPIAITALTSETLEKKGITDMRGIIASSPSITTTPFPGAAIMPTLYMRGQGAILPMSITTDSPIGIYQDGFYIARPQSSVFDLSDLERVEILRGPQGTLWGKNTTGGAINLISKEPSGEFNLRQKLTFGNMGIFRSLTTIDLPSVGDVATKFTYLKSDKDGYVKNIGSSHDYGEENQQAGRFALHWQARDDFSADFFYETGTAHFTGQYYENDFLNGRSNIPGQSGTYYTKPRRPDSHTWRAVDLPIGSSTYQGSGLTLAWDVNEALTIKSLTGYRTLDFHSYQDYAEAFGSFYYQEDIVKSHQFSQEIQFVGDVTDNLRYVAGLYYFSEGGSHDEPQTLGSSNLVAFPTGYYNTVRYVTADAKSRAAYAQTTWTPNILDNRLDITVGARFTKDERNADRIKGLNTTTHFETSALDSSRFNPMATINYAWTEDMNTYLKFATGYKAGGTDEGTPDGHFSAGAYGPEEVKTAELGLKSYVWDRRARINMALFYSKFDDMQMSFITSPTTLSETQGYNAGKATVKGAELELLVQPVDDLTLNLGYTYLNAQYNKVTAMAGTTFDPAVNLYSPYQVGEDIKQLFSMPRVPRHSVSASADYTFWHFDKAELSGRVDYKFESGQYLNAASGPAVPSRDFWWRSSFSTIDARLTLSGDLPRGDKASISLWGKNITNHRYRNYVVAAGGTVSPTSTGIVRGLTNYSEAWNEPVTFGIDLVYQYR